MVTETRTPGHQVVNQDTYGAILIKLSPSLMPRVILDSFPFNGPDGDSPFEQTSSGIEVADVFVPLQRTLDSTISELGIEDLYTLTAQILRQSAVARGN